MRKLFFLSAFFMMCMTACQKNEVSGGLSDDAQITICASLPSEMTETRATGDGTKVNRCIMEIYLNGERYGERQVVAVQNLSATFSTRLIAGKTFDLVFWADKANEDGKSDLHYDTSDLENVKFAAGDPYLGNDDSRDAFFGAVQVYADNSKNVPVVLHRPFGQLNVKTLDFDEVKAAAPYLEPKKVAVTFASVPTGINLLTGELTGELQQVEYANAVNVADAAGAMSFDYIFAPAGTDQHLVDFTMSFRDENGAEVASDYEFTNIPIQRNYRTNVSGYLLTKQGTIQVTIDPEFNEPDLNVPDLSDYPELKAALANGGSCTLTKNVTITAPLAVTGNKTVEIDLNGYNIINTISIPEGIYGNTTVFEVKDNATLTIKGDGNVQAIGTTPNEDGYRMAVYAYGNATVNIYGGSFYNDQDYNDHNAQLDLIYADQDAVINIYGGRFESSSANNRGYWVLNLKDNSNAAINVYGGTFVNFDPSQSQTENPVKNFVVEGSTVVKISETPAPNGTYEVVPEGGHVSVPIEVADKESLTEALSNPVIDEIAIVSDVDLSAESAETLTFTEHKTIDIKEGVTVKLGQTNRLTAEQGITLTGNGTIDNTSADNSDLGSGHEKALIHVMSGDCVIDGVTLINDPAYHWHGIGLNSSAISYWNDTNVVIRNAHIVSGEFTVCGMGRSSATGEVTLEDSYFESTSSNKNNGKNWAYALRLYGSKVRVNNCEVKGIQGGLSIEGCHDAVVSGGKYYTVNSSEQTTDAFYPLYVTNDAIVTITGGEFSGANRHTGLAIGGTSAVVCGDNDVDLPVGHVILKGGKFSGKAYNSVNDGYVYEPAEGYEWRALTDGGDLNWEVVPVE